MDRSEGREKGERRVVWIQRDPPTHPHPSGASLTLGGCLNSSKRSPATLSRHNPATPTPSPSISAASKVWEPPPPLHADIHCPDSIYFTKIALSTFLFFCNPNLHCRGDGGALYFPPPLSNLHPLGVGTMFFIPFLFPSGVCLSAAPVQPYPLVRHGSRTLWGGAGGYSNGSPATREHVFSSTTHPSVPRRCVNGHPPSLQRRGRSRACEATGASRCLWTPRPAGRRPQSSASRDAPLCPPRTSRAPVCWRWG